MRSAYAAAAAFAGDLAWAPIDAAPDFDAWLAYALAQQARGRRSAARDGAAPPPATSSGRPASSRSARAPLTRDRRHVAHPVGWGTGANVEAKLLQLTHAFEILDCVRVEFETDARNDRSRRAMEAVPAQFEGIHRRHRIERYGPRDTAWYSVIAEEWPDGEGEPPAPTRQAPERRPELRAARRGRRGSRSIRGDACVRGPARGAAAVFNSLSERAR